MTVKEAIYTIFQTKSQEYEKREMDLDFITYEILDNIDEFVKKGWVTETLRPKVTQAIQGFLPKTINGKQDPKSDSLLVRVPNGKGGFKSGVYRLRKRKNAKVKPAIAPVATSDISVINPPYVESAGRMAICSELLFRGYDVSMLTVNDFVDVVAVRKGKSFMIKAQTALMKSNSLSVRISEKSYNLADFVIVVVRATKRKQVVNQYMVVPIEDIRRWRSCRKATVAEKIISIIFTQQEGHIFIKGENVDHLLNNFGLIT